jgi:CopG family transcriptional regulator, nickel-responsive regulator
MANLTRISITIDEDLVGPFDSYLTSAQYPNRSEAIRDLVRERLIREETRTTNRVSLASLTVLYRPDTRELSTKLLRIEQEAGAAVLGVSRVAVDAQTHLAVYLLKAKANDLRTFGDRVLGLKGVLHGELVLTVPPKK